MAEERRTQEVEASPEEARFLRRFVRRTTLPWIASALRAGGSRPRRGALSASARGALGFGAERIPRVGGARRAPRRACEPARKAGRPRVRPLHRAGELRRRRRGSSGEAGSRARRTAGALAGRPGHGVARRPDRDPRPPLQARIASRPPGAGTRRPGEGRADASLRRRAVHPVEVHGRIAPGRRGRASALRSSSLAARASAPGLARPPSWYHLQRLRRDAHRKDPP